MYARSLQKFVKRDVRSLTAIVLAGGGVVVAVACAAFAAAVARAADWACSRKPASGFIDVSCFDGATLRDASFVQQPM